VWDELSDKVAVDNPEDGILLAKVDCTKEKDTCSRFSVRGYPTLLYFADRQMYRYSGPRDLDSLAAFAAGGYKDTTTGGGEDVPSPPSWFDEKMKDVRQMVESNDHLRMLAEDFEHILEVRKNAAALLVVIGAVVGLMVGCVLGGGGSKKSGGGKSKKE